MMLNFWNKLSQFALSVRVKCDCRVSVFLSGENNFSINVCFISTEEDTYSLRWYFPRLQELNPVNSNLAPEKIPILYMNYSHPDEEDADDKWNQPEADSKHYVTFDTYTVCLQ